MAAPRISVAIQHHPSRAELLPPLWSALRGLDVEVVADPDPAGTPNPWRCYRECLARTPAWATHRLVIQDDAEPCVGFAEAARAAVLARPAAPIAFFVGGAPGDACMAIRQAAAAGRSWIDLSPWQWFPAVAAVWPSEIVARLLEWSADPQVEQTLTRADDAVLAKFLQVEKIWPLATVPSLVEHPDIVPSVIGRRAWAGKDTNRVACVPAGSKDVTMIRW